MILQNNPIDTHEQREHERLALEYFQHPDVRKAYQTTREFWLDLVKPSEAMLSCFEAAFEEVMFGAVIWALNQDPLYPKVITISRVEHQLDGLRIPGSRWGIDNPDSIYRVIPVASGQRYVIRGRVAAKRLIENYFTLWSPTMQTLGLLDGKDLVVDSEGNFEISVDDSPANGRANHIQLSAEAKEFYIRDVIFDWAEDRPNQLSVERLDKHNDREPWSEAENIARIKEYMHKWADNTTRWNGQATQRPINAFDFVIDRDSDGALRNQLYILGQFQLPSADSALLLDVDLGGAEYFIAPITNVWGTTNEIVERSGCLNAQQAVANPDGTYSFVLSLQDPGVANWLDPCDMPEGILTLRWAEFADGRPTERCGVRSELISLAELKQRIEKSDRQTLAPISSEQRRQQLAERAASYAWRIG